MHNIYEANALHLYPQASYWDWPYTADKAPQRILQLDRDEMWYKTWARYAWKAIVSEMMSKYFGKKHIAKKFGIDGIQAQKVLTAYEETGEIALNFYEDMALRTEIARL